MKWLKWFKDRPAEEERYQMFRARFNHELEQQRRYAAEEEQRMHDEIMEEVLGPHGQG